LNEATGALRRFQELQTCARYGEKQARHFTPPEYSLRIDSPRQDLLAKSNDNDDSQLLAAANAMLGKEPAVDSKK